MSSIIDKLRGLKKSRRLKIKAEDRIMWYGAMASVSSAEMSLHQALTDMEPNFKETKHPMHAVVSQLLFRLRGGGDDAAGVMKRTIGTELMAIVPKEEAMLIQAGEASAQVANGYTNAALMVTAKSKMTSLVTSLLSKPLGYLGLLTVMMIFFHHELIPTYEAEHKRETWPTHAKIFGWFTDNIYALSALMIIVLGLTAFLVLHVVPRWTGERRERFDHYFPLSLVASLNGVSFLKSLAAYTGAGLPAAVSIPAIGTSGTPYMQWQCEKVMALMRQGMRLEQALSRLTIIPRRFHWIIAVYSKLKDASVAYNKMADSMTEEVTRAIEFYFGKVLGHFIFVVLIGSLLFVWFTFVGIATIR